MSDVLALELCQLIIQKVDEKNDLRSLALSCSAFRDEAQRYLFRDVRLTFAAQQQLFISTINSSPPLFGSLVHDLNITDDGWFYEGMAVSLSMALRAMPNLRHLELSWPKPSTILQKCGFKLQTFSIKPCLNRSEILFLLHDFLPTQDELKHLKIMVRSKDQDISDANVATNLCPRLDSVFLNNNDLLRILVPDTKLISHLQWQEYHSSVPELSIRQINHLKSLRYMTVSYLDGFFMQNLTSLVHLDLLIRVDGIDDLWEDIQHLQNIPRLEVLVLDLVHSYEEMSDDGIYTEFSAIFHRLFELCPSLQRVDLNYDDEDSVSFKRHIRRASGDNGDGVWEWVGQVCLDEIRGSRFGCI